MILSLVLLPAVAAVAAWLLRDNAPRRVLLVATAAAHALLVGWLWVRPASFPGLGAWLSVDGLGLVFLGITSLLFLAVSISAVGFLRRESGTTKADAEEGFLFDNIPEAVFTACLLGFLATMTLVTMSQHFGLLWVAIEATTLISAPLIHYHRHHRSLEATWKYLLICSVGIAFALLGTYFLAASVPTGSGGILSLTVNGLIEKAGELDPRWLKAGFLLLLVGYGTKMGLVPMHTWLPDAHSEAPSPVSALLSGALLNCAFLAILRILSVSSAAGLGDFGRETILVFGLVSMAVAAGLIIGQPDYKRMLAYSSVEHMGILAVGIGLGGLGNWGALFHAVNHSLTKAALFLLAGNLLAVYGTKRSADVRGALRAMPVTGALWVAGFFAILGSPPFGAFSSELTILRAAVDSRSWVVVVAFSLLLAAVFAGMISVLVRTAQGENTVRPQPGTGVLPGRDPKAALRVHEPALTLVAPLALLVLTAGLGIFVPAFLDRALWRAVLLLGV